MDYQNGKIYQITDTDYTKCYIGSTTQPLCKRLYHHKNSWKNGSKNKTSSFELFEEFGVENCIIELIESYPCENKDELTKREGYYIRNIICVNKKVEGRTKKEYDDNRKDIKKANYENNKEKIKRIQKSYRDSNKEILSVKQKKYREDNKDIIKEKQKLYRETNKESLNDYRKNYREANKEILKLKRKAYYESKKKLTSAKLTQ